VSELLSRVDDQVFGNVPLDVTIEGPDCPRLSDADLRRLFPGSTLTGVRLNRLRNWPRLVVRHENVPIALATYTQIDGETQIPDFAIDLPARLKSSDGTLRRRARYALLDAIELASIAGACRRIVLIPTTDAIAVLERRGYAAVNEGCAGAWLEKSLA
jgi:hypothetical protein